MRYWPSALLLMLACAVCQTSLAGPNDTDSQLWSEIDVSTPITTNTSILFIGVGRDGIGVPNPTLVGAAGLFNYYDGPWTYTGGEIWARIKKAKSGAEFDARLPLAAVAYTWELSGLRVTDVNRVEEIAGIPGDPRRYRNCLTFDWAVHDFGPVDDFIVSDEPFYDFSQHIWSRNRAKVGVGTDLSSSAALQLLYLRQDDRFSTPRRINAIDVVLEVRL